VAINEAAIPVIKGRKSEQEKFAGAEITYAIEGMMGDKRALQSGTSHNLGQNFAKAFDIKFVDESNQIQHCYTTSWGMSTRMVGGIIMAHGDDKGLRLPPRLAPIQVVVVPIFKNDDEKSKVMDAIGRIADSLLSANIRTHVDTRESLSPGFKFNDWEMKGVPIRMEVGPKDIEKGGVSLARRDMPGKESKQFAMQADVIVTVTKLLHDIQHNMLRQATEFRDENLHEAASYDHLKEIVEDGWALIWHCGTKDCEDQIKDETKASSRCFPIDINKAEKADGHQCAVCGKPAQGKAYFAKAY